ncbi:hypothetical protein LBE40_05640 [Bartonella taylorii]|uniref:Uncharacterized protein n=2 Tax=Bartonella taylorii TaxID=33046 RepID=A0A9Q8YX91_BARTA|nr:hypothetical protein [Bartonella taylorii]EJF92975.1 hypothetical protein ME9_01417 [Bartonella taylorii 8TBB]OPB34856.1 hypothetical protein Btaycd_010920 [Bartonella taylorii]USP00779.1 hypothetical protein LBE40_05640 [Bartonella taylorii]USP02761.1 hypothetical protein LAJ60_07865 [Bartonella taylorii]
MIFWLIKILYNDEITKDCPQFDVGFSINTDILTAACKVIDPINSQNLSDLQLHFDKRGLTIYGEGVCVDRLKLEFYYILEWMVEKIDLYKLF